MMWLRRFAPVLTAFFAVTLAVQVAGAACVMPGMHMAASSFTGESSAMTGMSETPSPSRIADSSRDGARHDAPCDAPGIPGNCSAFAPCGSALLGLAQESLGTMQPIHSQPAALVVLAPASPALLSELPPPRA